ncbi:MAG: hypothetical protein NVS9B3_14270 [Gemmatimonadaceae bacterium]
MHTMTFAFDYRPGESYRAQRAYHRLMRRFPLWPLWAVMLALFVVKIGDLRRGVWFTTLQVVGLGIVAVLLFLVFGVLPLATFYLTHLLPKREPALAAPRERTLTDRGIELRSTGVRAEVEWSLIRRGVETDEFFLLLPQGRGVYYLPKRALAKEGEVTAARVILASRLGGRFAALPGG